MSPRFVVRAALMIAVLGGASSCNFAPPPRLNVSPHAFSSGFEQHTTAAAQTCIDRIERHRQAVGSAYYTRATISLVSSLVGGTAGGGGGLVAALSSDPSTQEAAGIIALAGGVLGIVGTAISNAVAEPSDRLTMYQRSLAMLREAEYHALFTRDQRTWRFDMNMSSNADVRVALPRDCAPDSLEAVIVPGTWCKESPCTTANAASCSELVVFRRSDGVTVSQPRDDSPANNSGRCTLELTCRRRSPSARQQEHVRRLLDACAVDGALPAASQAPADPPAEAPTED